MDASKPTSAPRASAREQTHCADCRRPLTERERYLGETCIECEREYLLDTTSNPDDDSYPYAA
jgi:hypothetical protein